MFTHARCGGVLLPIASNQAPEIVRFGLAARYMPARCNRCHRAGEVAVQAEFELERRRLWRGLVRHGK